MESNRILLYGASGHAKVISSIFEAMNKNIDVIFDDNIEVKKLNNYNVINGYDKNYEPKLPILISIGNNKVRKRIANEVYHSFAVAIHPSSLIDTSVILNIGTAIFHGVIIQRNTIIGKHCIINTNAIVDHECIIEDFVHLSPSVTLCGKVIVGEGTHIGAGATIIQNIKIGKWCIIGAGAVITKNIPDYSLVVGIPGTIIKKLNHE